MLGENIKLHRQNRGFTQEEVASRLHVTRQTISKWEKNYSVPDADLLVRLAEILEVETEELLGNTQQQTVNVKRAAQEQQSEYAKQLANIAEQMAIKNRRSHKIWKTIGIAIIIIVGFNILMAVLGMTLFSFRKTSGQHNEPTVIEYETEEIIE